MAGNSEACCLIGESVPTSGERDRRFEVNSWRDSELIALATRGLGDVPSSLALTFLLQ